MVVNKCQNFTALLNILLCSCQSESPRSTDMGRQDKLLNFHFSQQDYV